MAIGEADQRLELLLSITIIVSPVAFKTSSAFQIRCRIAAPSLRRLVEDEEVGLVIKVRPIASICCSPPESWLPPLVSRSARCGKKASTRSSVHASLVPAPGRPG